MSQSHRLGRVVSDLSHSNSRSVTTMDHSLQHQNATTTSKNEGGNVGKATKHKLSLFISSVVSSWTRSESSGGETAGGGEKNGSSRKQQQANGGGTGGRRRRGGLEIVLAVRKYVAMVEQLFTSSSSYSASSSSRPDADRRRRPHTFTSARHVAGGNANAAHAQSSSKRLSRRRLSSAPASLRGSPATSGHLYVGESVTKHASMSTSSSSEVSTMEELQSAIQAAIAHCKNSIAAAAGGDDKQRAAAARKC